jgi:hypothetical protein
LEPASIICKSWRYIIWTSGGKFHQEQSSGTDGDLLFGHNLSPNEPFLTGIPQKIRDIKAQGLFCDLFSLSLPSPSFSPPLAYSLSLSFLIYFNLLLCTIMSPIQSLPSFSRALDSDDYKTILPNITYPSRPIPCSSAPLVFSVSQTFFFYVFCRSLTFFLALRIPYVQRLQLLTLSKLVNTFSSI